ncbi:MAG: FHA domain-containing protein [Chloroflexi bacterium]|nr:FHA domain-containing protein [Chloroflexota bacterium]
MKCHNCGYLNRPGILVCENCGISLVGNTTNQNPVPTRSFASEVNDNKVETSDPNIETRPPESSTNKRSTDEVAIASAGSDVFEENMTLRLEIEGAPMPILIYPKQENRIGRRDPATGTMPDVDLTSYAGYRMGVSRNHAMLRLNGSRLEIADLGSSNGTAVNGTKLTAHQPHVLRDGDELMLGKMVMRVIFQITKRPR